MSRRKSKVGDFVKQGDIIGYVGSTGSSSGNHVCYRFWKNGREVDPFKEKLPTAKPMKKDIKPIFFDFIKSLKYQLDYKKVPVKEPNLISEITPQN
jgi:murein DD-endopeptidase MepM/ murein hydrolase activator NlpD